MQVPEAAIRWIVSNSLTSNSELAVVTNVDRRWRQVVRDTLLEVSVKETAHETVESLHDRPYLLLPSMIRRLQELSEHRSVVGSLWQSTRETFCAAWFHPHGIQEVTVSLQTVEEEDECSVLSSAAQSVSEAFAPSGGQTYCGSEDEDALERKSSRHTKKRPGSVRSRSPAPFGGLRMTEIDEKNTKQQDVVCCYEWRGYRNPMDVLKHFGFASHFVQDTLQRAANLRRTKIHNNSLEDSLGMMTLHQPTFAVRGATIARPESYCMCLDEEEEKLEKKLKEATNGKTGSGWVDIHQQEFKQSVARRNRRRRELQRDVLPRVLTREHPEGGRSSVIGRRQRSLQFLNAGGSHAVCMTTPMFGCDPVPEPITLFCVGIATEDGCFLSGLFHRFELGHLYPNNATAEATEQSSVCIVTESWEVKAHRKDSLDSLPYKFSSDDSSYESSGGHASSDIKCDCCFKGVNDKLDLLYNDDNARHQEDSQNSDDTAHNRRIHRGRLGPGSWHCYAVVVDGPRSLIRIDGVDEPIDVELKDASMFHRAMLDGLTIGSDHCFGMSLCCGFGSGGGEGEGAIAELAVFGGRLDLADIELLEKQMIERHGIMPVDTKECRDELWHEYQLMREAHALYANCPQSVNEEGAASGGVPLRYLARHRLVAWHQQNPVSGKEVRITKIGCRPDADSSDWD